MCVFDFKIEKWQKEKAINVSEPPNGLINKRILIANYLTFPWVFSSKVLKSTPSNGLILWHSASLLS